jgi:6-phosphogluconolactonase (cycloisomerase 2 family)
LQVSRHAGSKNYGDFIMIKTLRTAIVVALAATMGGTAAHASVRTSLFSDSVYVMSNSAAGNRVAVLRRSPSGGLTNTGTFATGGKGSGPGELIVSDPLGSQGSMLLSPDARWLFTVNAGSNQISAFKVTDDGLRLTSVVSSGGTYPVSLTLSGNVLYALNAVGDGSVAGFRLTRSGQLQPIEGSVRSLHAATPSVVKQPSIVFSPSQVSFSPDGDWLVVTDKNAGTLGTIQLFKVDPDGMIADAPVVTNSGDQLPFGFTFDRRGHLLVTETGGGAVSSYDINDNGTLTPISQSVLNGQSQPCWIDTTRNFAFVVNTLSQNITGYRVNRRGQLSLLSPNGSNAQLGTAGTAGAIDVNVSGDGRFLNVVTGDTGIVRTFRINPLNGALTLTGQLKVFEGNSGMMGIAAE